MYWFVIFCVNDSCSVACLWYKLVLGVVRCAITKSCICDGKYQVQSGGREAVAQIGHTPVHANLLKYINIDYRNDNAQFCLNNL